MLSVAPQRLTKRVKRLKRRRPREDWARDTWFSQPAVPERLLCKTKPRRLPPALEREMQRRTLSALARELTSRRAVSCCGLALLGKVVEIRARRSEPATFCGVMHCKGKWECVDCMVKGQQVAAETLQEANAIHRGHGGDILMLTLTLPHGVGDALRAIRRRVSRSWQYVQQGAPWKRFKNRFAVEGSVRALEVTHGEQHGFHPHLHVALYTARPLEDAELAELREYASERWRKAITSSRHGDPWPAPHPVHGVKCTRLTSTDYLVKMGLDARELVSSSTKEGREGGRSPLQVLHALKLARDAGDRERERFFTRVWEAYTRGMLGARQLTYSRGFLESLGLKDDDPPDDQLELDGCDGEEVVARLSAEDFNRVRARPLLLAQLRYVSVCFQPGQWAEVVRRLVGQAWNHPHDPLGRGGCTMATDPRFVELVQAQEVREYAADSGLVVKCVYCGTKWESSAPRDGPGAAIARANAVRHATTCTARAASWRAVGVLAP